MKHEQEFEDSEDEREYKDQQKALFTTEFCQSEQFDSKDSTLVILQGGLSQAVARIMFEDSWKEVA